MSLATTENAGTKLASVEPLTRYVESLTWAPTLTVLPDDFAP